MRELTREPKKVLWPLLMVTAMALAGAAGCSDDDGPAADSGVDSGDAGDASVDSKPPSPVKSELIILHTNDLHSHLMGFAPNSAYTPDSTDDDNTIGGFARLAAKIAAERAAAGSTPVLVLDAGDFMMGSIFPLIGRTQAAELVEMGKMGYDAIALGNHEFDWGPKPLSEFISAARSNGFDVPLMATNIKFDSSDAADDDLAAHLTSGALKRKMVKTLPDGLKVGFIGFLGKNASDVAPAAKPVTFDEIGASAKAAAADLRDSDKVDLVIAVSHSGTSRDGQTGEDIDMAKAAPDLDVIISGHTHVALSKPTTVGKTHIVQAGSYGRYLGKLVLNIHEDGTTSVKSYELMPIDDKTKGDADTQTRIDGYISEVDKQLAGQNTSYKEVIAETDFDLTLPRFKSSNLANLITDSYLDTVAKLQPSDPPVISIESPGTIRDELGKGQQWFSDVFRVLPLGLGPDGKLGYPLMTLYITPAEIKIVLEATALAANLEQTDYFLHAGGLSFEYDSEQTIFSRVTSIKLDDGTSLGLFDKSKCYKVVTNFYIYGLLGLLKSIGAPEVVPKEKDCSTPVAGDGSSRFVDADPNTAGVQELKQYQALLRYLGTFPDTDNNSVPNVPQKYSAPDGRLKCTGSKCPQ